MASRRLQPVCRLPLTRPAWPLPCLGGHTQASWNLPLAPASVVAADTEVPAPPGSQGPPSWGEGGALAVAAAEVEASSEWRTPRQQPAPPAAILDALLPQAAAGTATVAAEAAEQRAAAMPPGGSASWQALGLIWAPLAALALSSAIALTLFPFFTFVPTSGLLGETLPRVGLSLARPQQAPPVCPDLNQLRVCRAIISAGDVGTLRCVCTVSLCLLACLLALLALSLAGPLLCLHLC